jgi:hypothetical protein
MSVADLIVKLGARRYRIPADEYVAWRAKLEAAHTDDRRGLRRALRKYRTLHVSREFNEAFFEHRKLVGATVIGYDESVAAGLLLRRSLVPESYAIELLGLGVTPAVIRMAWDNGLATEYAIELAQPSSSSSRQT